MSSVTKKPSQGYVFLATGKRRYHEMAINAALSARWKDPGRRVCLVHDEGPLPDYIKDIFDDFVELPSLDGYIGVMDKMRLYDLSPYDETFFIDGDCIIVKSDMDRHWQKFGAQDMSMAGDRATAGRWHGFEIRDACAAVHAPYMVQGNAGVFFFRKSELAKAVFDDSLYLVEHKSDALGEIHQGRKGQLACEPFMAAAMGRQGVEPLQYTPAEGSIMISTMHGKLIRADMQTEESRIYKPDAYSVFGQLPINKLFALKYVSHTPTIIHFIDLKPSAIYRKLSKQLRGKFGVPLFDFAKG